MRQEPPDVLTEQVWQMLAAARTNPMPREAVIEQLLLSLRRTLNDVAYRARRGRQTAYDEVVERDLEALACAIVLLQEADAARQREGDV